MINNAVFGGQPFPEGLGYFSLHLRYKLFKYDRMDAGDRAMQEQLPRITISHSLCLVGGKNNRQQR